MDIVTELWDLEGVIKSAEKALLRSEFAETRAIIESMVSSPLREHVHIDEAIERMQGANDRNYCSHYRRVFNFWWNESDEGYAEPSLSPYNRSVQRNDSWYSRMRVFDSHYDFVNDIVFGMDWKEGREEGESYEGLAELLALSTIRKYHRKLWERLVTDIVRTRYRTPLESIAKVLRLRLAWIVEICTYFSRLRRSDNVVTDEMVYLCSDPDYDLKPLVDLPDPPEAKVMYLVICPSCKHRNEQGRTTCDHCGAPL